MGKIILPRRICGVIVGLHKDEGELTSLPPWPWHLVPWLILAFGIVSLCLGLFRIIENPWAMEEAAYWTIYFMLFALPVIPGGVFLVLRNWFHMRLRLVIVIAFAVFGLLLPFIGMWVLGFMFR